MPTLRSALRLCLGVCLGTLLAACSGDDHGEHDFETFAECYEHHIEEDLTDVGATEECDAIFEIEHDDNADCLADHEADVADGVPQDAIDAHCDDVAPA